VISDLIAADSAIGLLCASTGLPYASIGPASAPLLRSSGDNFIYGEEDGTENDIGTRMSFSTRMGLSSLF
jgi:hypothetical protein